MDFGGEMSTTFDDFTLASNTDSQFLLGTGNVDSQNLLLDPEVLGKILAATVCQFSVHDFDVHFRKAK